MTRDRQTDGQTDRHPHRFMIWPHVVGHITFDRECASVNYSESASAEAQFTWDNLSGDAYRVLDVVTIIGSSVQLRPSGLNVFWDFRSFLAMKSLNLLRKT